jgi:heme/copper-type cytochrome/quinol oxidase subunit 4
MKPIWDFILSSLRESLSNQSEQSLAGIAIVLILLALLIPVYLVMKIFRISGTIEVRDPTITGDVLDKLISTGQDTSARQDAQIPESRQQFVRNLESARRSGLEFYKLLTFGIAAVLTCIGIYFASIATVANGLILPTIMIFAAAFFVFTGMQKFREMMTPETPEPLSIHFTETERTSEPTVVRMENDDLQKAASLLVSGKDMDSVCAEINPDYANWGSLQKQLFRKTMEEVLKSQPSKGN